MNRLPPALAVCAAVLLSGCDQVFQNKSERHLAEAEKKCATQEYPEAVLLYEAALDGTPKTAEIHYKLGLIYEEKINAPVSAVHHFHRYLALEPKGPHARDAQKFLKEDQFKLAATLGNGATVPQEEARRLKNSNLELQRQIVQLKSDLEAAKKGRVALPRGQPTKMPAQKPTATQAAIPASSAGQTQRPLQPGVRTYTVTKGDTLASISRKFYKNNSGRWKTIQDANFEGVEGTARLQPGMVLMIP